MINMLAFFASAGKGLNVFYQLSDVTVTSSCPNGQTCDYDIFFNSNGTRQHRVDLVVGGTQLNSLSAWTNEPGMDGTGWYIRLVSHDTGNNVFTNNLTLGTWYELTSNRSFEFQQSDPNGPYSDNSTYTFGLSNDGGSSTFDTMTLDLTLFNQGP